MILKALLSTGLTCCITIVCLSKPAKPALSRSTATVIEFMGKNSGSARLSFFDPLSNKQITYTCDRKEYMVTGDKFEIEYNTLKPKKDPHLLYHTTTFDPNEGFMTTYGIIQANNSKDVVEYKYVIANHVYDRFQLLAFPLLSNNAIKPGVLFEVRYVKQDPQRALINLDAIVDAKVAMNETGFYFGQDLKLKDDAGFTKTTCKIIKVKNTRIKYSYKQYNAKNNDSTLVKCFKDILVNADSNNIKKGDYSYYFSPVDKSNNLVIFDNTMPYSTPKVLSHYAFVEDPANFSKAYFLLTLQNSIAPDHNTDQQINITLPYSNKAGQMEANNSKVIHTSPLHIQSVTSLGFDLGLGRFSGYANCGFDADNAYSIINSVKAGIGHDFHLKEISQNSKKLKIVFRAFGGYAYYKDSYSIAKIDDSNNDIAILDHTFSKNYPIDVTAHFDRHFLQAGLGVWLFAHSKSNENGYSISKFSVKADVSYNYLLATDSYISYGQSAKSKYETTNHYSTQINDSRITTNYTNTALSSSNFTDNFIFSLTLAYRLL